MFFVVSNLNVFLLFARFRESARTKSKSIDSCVLNRSEYNLKIRKTNKNIMCTQENIKKIMLNPEVHKVLQKNCEFYMRAFEDLKRFKVICCVAFGYAKKIQTFN